MLTYDKNRWMLSPEEERQGERAMRLVLSLLFGCGFFLLLFIPILLVFWN